ncbi:MAG: O-antigen ligase family protein [Defluviitaleaceae bacterium]|nr:O-antigen ligase family protein [Defluviitaleaceae bacterium]
MGVISEAIKIIICAAFFFVAYNATDENRDNVRNALVAWTVGLNIFIVYGLYVQLSLLSGLEPWVFNTDMGHGGRFVGTMADGNAAALYLSVSFFVVHILFRYFEFAKGTKIWLGSTMVVTVLCIFLTFSRGGLIGFLCALAVLVVFSTRRYIRHIWIAPAVLCALLFTMFLDTRFMESLMTYNQFGRITEAVSGGGMLQVRLNKSITALQMGMDNIFLGVGRGNFPLNSLPYFVEMGIDEFALSLEFLYVGMVPHNTIAGTFAEMGMFGVVVFLSLFVIMAIKILKNENFDRDFKVIMLALWVGVFVQSLALSLENTRIVWITAAIILCFADNKVVFAVKQYDIKGRGIGLRPRMLVAVVCLVLCAFLYDYVAIRFIHGRLDISNDRLTFAFHAQQDERHTLRYHVATVSHSDTCEPMTVTIKRESTGEIVNEIVYNHALGYANLSFYPYVGGEYVIEFTGSGSSSVFDVRIIKPNSETQVLAGPYPLLPSWLHNVNARNNRLISQTADSTTTLPRMITGLLSEDEWLDFGEKIRFKGVSIETDDYGITFFNLVFEYLQELERRYLLWVHLIPDDINNLPCDLRTQTFSNLDHDFGVANDVWQVGNIYTHTFSAHIPEGNYTMSFGFWIPSPYERLITQYGVAGTTIGWFTIPS